MSTLITLSRRPLSDRRKAGAIDDDLKVVLERAGRIRNQQQRDSNRIYSWHEPQVRCTSKGKARQRYEFGQKAAPAAANRGNWIVAARPLKDNPYGHTLSETLQAVESITGVGVSDAYVDKGYRGHGCERPTRVHIAGSRLKSPTRGAAGSGRGRSDHYG